MDGITTVLIDVEDASSGDNTGIDPVLQVKIVGLKTIPYPEEVKAELLRFSESRAIHELCNFSFYLGRLFAQNILTSIKEFGRDVGEIQMVASHGQTIRHFPHGLDGYAFSHPSTMQIGELDIIAAETGVNSVGSFHAKDIALGGEGAPATYAHCVLFRHPTLRRGVLNLGGIANITYLPPGVGTDHVLAFDTGPACMIIDALMEETTQGKLLYDHNGECASSGQVDQPLLEWLMNHPYVLKEPPKSTGRQEFGGHFSTKVLNRARAAAISDEDLIATVTQFSVDSIVGNLKKFVPTMDELILTGGGAQNETIARALAQSLEGTTVTTTVEHGIPLEATEAMTWALMSYATAKGRSSNVPSVTGAKREVVMGKVSWEKEI